MAAFLTIALMLSTFNSNQREREKSLIAFSGYISDGRQDDPHLSINSMLVFRSRPE